MSSRPSPRVRVAVLAACGLLAVPASASAQDPNATDLVQTVTRNGETLTMRLHKVPLRGPHFEVRVQNLLGGYDAYAPTGPDRAYLGTVDGRPGAVASGIVADDGDLRGQIAFDRGATWFTDGTTVTGTRGLDAPTLKWPSTTTLSPGLADGRMRAWDLGVDVTSGYYLNAGRGGSSAAKTLEQVEYSLSNVRAIYMRDAETMPRLGRVVVRAVAARDPFAPGGTTAGLGAFRDEWRANQTDAVRDEALVVDAGGGGVAYRVAFGPDYAYARSGSDDDGPFDVVTRHEIGHNWNVGDNESENAEGATIMNGNGYARFSGPELQTMLTSRKARVDVLDDLGRWASTGLPPYAALDLADDVAPGTTTTVDVLANDHDANAQALTLTAVDATTKAGGTARVADGKVRYTAPSGAYGLDSFGYTVTDACGQTATGVVLARASGTAATATSAGAATSGTTGTASADAGRTTCASDGTGAGGTGTGPGGGSGAGTGGGTAG
ncbi:Ig-like domain-containing protein, partial [Patulibacter minatonensis]|uniref:Ig-like domain-containing protein n=1 Tax=Patulibacter minatonensis TaxID=298163 RepID=UPI00068422DC